MASFFSCKSTDSFKITDPFPFNECTSLVIYGAKSFDDNPDKSFQSIVFHNYSVAGSGITADNAPYLTALHAKDMLNDIVKWKNKGFSKNDIKNAKTAEKWVKQKEREGWTHFLYEAEPEKYAGNAYLWAQYAEKNK